MKPQNTADTASAIADLQQKWNDLKDVDRARAVHAIQLAGTSLRALAKALNCKPILSPQPEPGRAGVASGPLACSQGRDQHKRTCPTSPGRRRSSRNGVPATEISDVGSSFMKVVIPEGATTGPITVTTTKGTLTSNKMFVVRP